MIFRQVKVKVVTCSTCGRETPHSKVGTNHTLHFLASFLTFFFWTPLWMAAALMERLRPYSCSVCSGALSPGVRRRQDKPLHGGGHALSG